MSAIKYSVVIPVFQAAGTLRVLTPSLVDVMKAMGEDFEIILTDDGSTDDSWKVLCSIAETEKRVRIYRLAKNVGQLQATTCGLQHALGDIAITMDDDLQFSPKELPALLHYFHSNNYSLVFGVADNKVNSALHGLNRSIARVLFQYVFLYRYRNLEYFSSLRVMDMRVFRSGLLSNIFMIWKLEPDVIGNFAVQHHPTLKEKTSYTFYKRVLHFEPYLLFAVEKTLIFIVLFLFVSLLFCFKQTGFLFVWILFICSLSSLIFVRLRLKKSEKISYKIAEKQ